jgi:D-alanyl-D-alanine carboxypeptidase
MNKRTLYYSPLLLAATLACAKQLEPVTAPEPIVVGPPPRPVQVLQAEIDTLLTDPAFANAHWGVMVQSVETGEILYRHNQRKLFMPASNMKVVTGSVALARLGADHRFRTRVGACGSIDSVSGTLNGDLLVVGGGDPSISQRFSEGEDPLATFRDWADSLEALGITRISGNVIGDDDLFDDVHIGPGWAWDYLGAAYAAEIGALLFNEGALGIRYQATPMSTTMAPVCRAITTWRLRPSCGSYGQWLDAPTSTCSTTRSRSPVWTAHSRIACVAPGPKTTHTPRPVCRAAFSVQRTSV